MDAFLEMTHDQRRRLCGEAEARLGLRAASIEKDFWICWALRELFALDEIGNELTFKGGTSLSKGWKLIERFSEDLDVTVSRAYLGFGGADDPAAAGSVTSRNRRVEQLRERCAEWVEGSLTAALRSRFEARLPAGERWRIALDDDDDQRLTILYDYPTVEAEGVRSGAYVRPVVKIELGALSDTEPCDHPTMEPYLAGEFADLLPGSRFSVRALAPVRTFWEKAMLLHEENFRTGKAGPKPRMARHYYDLWCLIEKGLAEKARGDMELFQRVALHRSIYFRKNLAARESLRPGALRIRPRKEHLELWRRDYAAMQETMFFGTSPEFDEILAAVEEFEAAFNRSAGESAEGA